MKMIIAYIAIAMLMLLAVSFASAPWVEFVEGKCEDLSLIAQMVGIIIPAAIIAAVLLVWMRKE